MFEVDHTECEQQQEWKNSDKMDGRVDERKDGWMGGRMGGWEQEPARPCNRELARGHAAAPEEQMRSCNLRHQAGREIAVPMRGKRRVEIRCPNEISHIGTEEMVAPGWDLQPQMHKTPVRARTEAGSWICP